MSLSITQVKAKISPKLHGTTLAQLSGSFYEKCREAAGNVLSRCHPLETIRSSRIENAIYSHIYNYAINQDVRGDRGIIDIRPIGPRSTEDDLHGRGTREFDIKRNTDTFAIEIVNGIKTLRLSKRIGEHSLIHAMDSLTGGGTITGSGDVTSLTTNRLEYVSGNAAIQFRLDGVTGQGKITIVLPSQVDLSTIEDIGALFHWLNFPNKSRLTNIKFRWGNDASNYWEYTITSPHDRDSFESAVWTLQAAHWVDAAETGSPDATAVNWIEIELNYTAGTALANVRLDNITAAKGAAYEAVYYSDRFFKSTGGSYLEVPENDSDVILIAGDGGHNIFLYELALAIKQELGENKVKWGTDWLVKQLNGFGQVPGLYEKYQSQYPSKTLPTTHTYYDFGNFEN